MEWQREGLLSELELQKAKEKILGDEPNLPRMACLPASPSTVYPGRIWPGGRVQKVLECLACGQIWRTFAYAVFVRFWTLF